MVLVNNSAPNGKLTLDMITDRQRNEEFRRKSVEAFPYESDALVSEKQKRQGEAKVEILAGRTMITLWNESYHDTFGLKSRLLWE